MLKTVEAVEMPVKERKNVKQEYVNLVVMLLSAFVIKNVPII
jgi:hypothetical protein